jgi:glyoxylase-like metal-dependent hydrolase (beta-lactamase superfamily II)
MEGAFTIDASKRFVPFDLGTDNLQERPAGSLLVEIQPFVVITDEDILLLDTGLGFRTADQTLQIHRNLVEQGINPMEVTKVLMSHLHKDHAGGMAAKDPASGLYSLSFPGATYYVQRKELAYALEKGASSYMPEELALLQHTDKVVLLDEMEGHIGDTIRYEVTGGHSPFHQVFWIGPAGQDRGSDGPECIFFGGDDAPQLGQMKNKVIAKYDYDGKKCMELRRKWWAEAGEKHWTLLFYHDIKYPSITL